MMIDLQRSRLSTLSARIARKASNHDTNDKAIMIYNVGQSVTDCNIARSKLDACKTK